MWRCAIGIAAALCAGLLPPAEGRTWTDSTGKYQVEADLVGFNDTMVILKKADRQLVAVPTAKLSETDNVYLKSEEAVTQGQKSAEAMQTWTMATGLKVIGRVVNYGRKDVTIQRRRSKIYVNDRLFNNLPEIYQKMVPKIVSYFEKIDIPDKVAFESWVLKLRGTPRTYMCEGVVLELPGGDEYSVPFFFFSPDDLKILQPGWERWLAADTNRYRQEQESFLLEQQAQAYQQDRMAQQQIAMMQFEMTGYAAGLFDLWEVALRPRPGIMSPPLVVVVPGRDSRSAAMEAMRRYPGFVAGAASKVVRKY
jgi:hypothetical protein